MLQLVFIEPVLHSDTFFNRALMFSRSTKPVLDTQTDLCHNPQKQCGKWTRQVPYTCHPSSTPDDLSLTLTRGSSGLVSNPTQGSFLSQTRLISRFFTTSSSSFFLSLPCVSLFCYFETPFFLLSDPERHRSSAGPEKDIGVDSRRRVFVQRTRTC